MNSKNLASQSVRRYLAALAATADIEAPYGAVLFTMLTSLMPLPDLLRPTTTAADRGRLIVAATRTGHGPRFPKVIQLPGHTVELLGRPTTERAVASCLGIQPGALPAVRRNLQLQLADHDDLEWLDTPEQVWSNAVHAVMAAVTTAEQRTAVLSYAGLHPSAPVAGARGQGLTDPHPEQIAKLIDALASDAGFGSATPLTAVSPLTVPRGAESA